MCLAATLPSLSTLRDYFVNDDFGVVQLLSRKPRGYFPRWFVTSWMEGIWGYTPAWDAATGARFRVTEQQYPGLRAIVLALPQAGSPEAMDQAMVRVVMQVVRGFPVRE